MTSESQAQSAARSASGAESLRARLRPVLERVYEAFNRGDFDTAFAGIADDFEFHPDPSVLDRRVVRGRDELIAYMRSARDAFPNWGFEPQEYIDAGASKLIVRGMLGGVGGGSGLEVRIEAFMVYETEGGVLARLYEFGDREAAFERAGLAGP